MEEEKDTQFYVDKINIDKYLHEMEEEDAELVRKTEKQEESDLIKGKRVKQ